ncbi:MAG TPA: TniQ family protein [Pyrinomonadaceae bacterium]|nr:TniQ family protein [Pyrinomonadaceae bacterium]
MGNVIELLRRGNPKPGESLLGFVLRLTEQNGYKSPSLILKSAGIKPEQLSQTCSFLFNPNTNLEPLAKVTGASFSDLIPLTYPHVESSSPTPLYLFYNAPLPHLMFRARRPAICPRCLLETGYCRRIWDLLFVTNCPIHKCMLIDVCPNCKKHISWVRSSVSECSCKFDWRRITYKQIEEAESKGSWHIYLLCGLLKSKPNGRHLKKPDFLTRLDLQGFIQAMLFIVSRCSGLIGPKRGKLKGKQIHELHIWVVNAFTILENWSDQFHAFLDWYYFSENNLLFGLPDLRSLLRKKRKNIQTNFYNEFSSSQLEFLRKEIKPRMKRLI